MRSRFVLIHQMPTAIDTSEEREGGEREFDKVRVRENTQLKTKGGWSNNVATFPEKSYVFFQCLAQK